MCACARGCAQAFQIWTNQSSVRTTHKYTSKTTSYEKVNENLTFTGNLSAVDISWKSYLNRCTHHEHTSARQRATKNAGNVRTNLIFVSSPPKHYPSVDYGCYRRVLSIEFVPQQTNEFQMGSGTVEMLSIGWKCAVSQCNLKWIWTAALFPSYSSFSSPSTFPMRSETTNQLPCIFIWTRRTLALAHVAYIRIKYDAIYWNRRTYGIWIWRDYEQ